MSEKNDIEQFFRRIVQKSQVISVGVGVSLLLAMLSLGVLFCTLALYAKFSKEHAVFILVFFSLLSVCAFMWAFRHWFRDRSWLFQAQKAEVLLPELRGSLLCSLELESGSGSSPIQKRVIQHAHEGIKEIPIPVMTSKRPLWRSFSLFSSIVFALLLLQLFFPLTPLEALASLRAKPQEEVKAEQKENMDTVKVEIADISLRYEFPDYTKLDPITVRNSDGTIHAPFETKVLIQARSKEEFTTAFVQVNDREPIPAQLDKGSLISVEIQIEEPGFWKFILEKETKKAVSDEFHLEVDGDNAPVVTLESNPPETLANNQSLNIQWSAKDDYGLKKILVEYEVNGEKRSKSIRSFKNPKGSYKGRLSYTPKRLGLKSGDRVELKIVAYDNQPLLVEEDNKDEFAHIGKRGESATVSFMVIGPKLQGERLVEANKEFLAALLPPFADFLVESVPPVQSDSGMVAWAAQVQNRFVPLLAATKKHWGDEIATDYTAELVLKVLDTSGLLMRFVRTTYDPKKMGRVKRQDRETFASLHEQQIIDLEKAVYLIDRMLRMTHFQMLLSSAEDALSHATKIDGQLQRDDVARQAKKNRMARLDRALKEVDKAVSGMSENSMQQFVLLYRQQIDNLRTEMDTRDAELDDEQYDILLEELTESVAEMHEGIQEQLRRQKDEEDKKNEEFRKLIEALKEQKKDQLSLSEELENTRSELDQASQERVETWNELQRLSDDAQDASEQLTRDLGGGDGFRSGSIRQYDKQERALRDLQNAIKARDYEQSYRELSMAMRMNRSVQSQNYTEKNRERLSTEPQARNIDKIQKQSDRIEEDLQKLRERLNQFDNDTQESPELQRLAQELSSRQQDLNSKQSALEQQTEKVEQGMPTADGSASKFLKEATESMKDAQDLLEMGASVRGEGFQRDGAQKIQKTMDRLMQQQQEMQKMKKQAQQMSGKGKNQEDKGKGKEDGEELASNPLDLTEDMTPEEYRKALLEGMSGSVPEEYQLLKKRYYEELVQQ